MINQQQIDAWLSRPEDEHLEFKQAKPGFPAEELAKYCAALANEGGGTLILGVTDGTPHRVVGTAACQNLDDTKYRLATELHLRVGVEEYQHPNGRVLVFDVPSHPLGTPINYKGTYWMRVGESTVAMTDDMLRRIFAEAIKDFSAEICPRASLSDLHPVAIQEFRARLRNRPGNEDLFEASDEQLLRDLGLIKGAGITYAALVLFGSAQALRWYMGQAEIVFEYRLEEDAIEYDDRREFREGFFLIFDKLWETVNLRNKKYHVQDGLFITDIPAFNEKVVREALLNAVSHRDYTRPGSVFIRQYANWLEIVSPGALPEGVTPDNILERQEPRNRLIAESFARCGLVERAGQGFDKMYRLSIQESKSLPEVSEPYKTEVRLVLQGTVRDANFVRFLDKVAKQTQQRFSLADLFVLDYVHGNQRVPDNLRTNLNRLRDLGIVEVLGYGRGTAYTLSKDYYDFTGTAGIYTRRLGLNREQNMELILKHLRRVGRCGITDFEELLSLKNRNQIHNLLINLKREGKIRFVGQRKSGYWELAR